MSPSINVPMIDEHFSSALDNLYIMSTVDNTGVTKVGSGAAEPNHRLLKMCILLLIASDIAPSFNG